MRRYGVIAEGNGLTFGPGRIGTDAVTCLGRWVPQVQVPEDVFDDIGVVDERDDAHGGAAVGPFERIDLVTGGFGNIRELQRVLEFGMHPHQISLENHS